MLARILHHSRVASIARHLFLCLIAFVLSGVGCGGSDHEKDKSGVEGERDASAEVGEGDVGTSESRFSKATLEELHSIKASKFFGAAVVKSVEERADSTKVTFEPSSGPICLRGAEFSMFYKDRSSDKTMILLDGGGACWSDLCLASEEVRDEIMDSGIASSDADNYFSDWNVVTVPYCDGSVFSGENELTEPEDGTTRYHHGKQNLAAALDQAVEHFGHSTKVLIGGFSAGAYGTLSGMVAVRLAFPDVDLFVMSDSGPGVQNPENAEATAQRVEEWRYDKTVPPSCIGCDNGYGQQSQMFQWMLDNDDTVKISVLSYFGDSVIGGVFNEMSAEEYKELLLSETDPIHANHPDRFKRFMLPGAGHVVSAGWDTVTASGVKVSDWVTAMVTGDDSVWTDILADGP